MPTASVEQPAKRAFYPLINICVLSKNFSHCHIRAEASSLTQQSVVAQQHVLKNWCLHVKFCKRESAM